MLLVTNRETPSSSLYSKPVEWLRFFCAVCVVFLHAFIVDGHGMVSFQNGLYDTVRILISQGFCRVAVPVFFIISGYLFFQSFGAWNSRLWGNKLLRRVKTLLIPYVIWNFLSIIISGFAIYLQLIKNPIPWTDWLKSIGGIKAFWDSGTGFPHNYPLWFIRNLMVLNLLAPLFYFYVKFTRLIGISLLFSLYLFNIWFTLPGLEPVGFFFYALGAYFCLLRVDLIATCMKYLKVVLSISFLLLLLMVLLYGNHPIGYDYAHRLFTLFGSMAVIGTTGALFCQQRIRNHPFLSDSSFFIYAAHGMIVLPLIQSLLKRMLPSTTEPILLLQYLLAPLLTIFLLLAIFRFMRLFLPLTTSLLVGGRVSSSALSVVSRKERQEQE